MADQHRILTATLTFEHQPGKTTIHHICACSCGWTGRSIDTVTADPLGAGLQLVSRMHSAWEVHLNPVAQVTA